MSRPSRRCATRSRDPRACERSRLTLVAGGETARLCLGASLSLRVHPLVVLLTTLRGRPTRVRSEARVGDSRSRHQLSSRRHGRLPVEDDAVGLADDDGRSLHCAETEELVLDAELLETIREVADRLL